MTVLTLSDGSSIELSDLRAAERARRMEMPLPKDPTLWQYASLLDVLRAESGCCDYQYLGMSASAWLTKLEVDKSPDFERARQWFLREGEPFLRLRLSSKTQRPPLTSLSLKQPRFISLLENQLQNINLRRASAAQWKSTINRLTTKGISREEIEESDAISQLEDFADAFGPHEMLTDRDVLEGLCFDHVVPTLTSEAEYGFVAKSGWARHHQTIPANRFKKFGLIGNFVTSQHTVRYMHRSMGWKLIESHCHDLVSKIKNWWTVLDERECVVGNHAMGFRYAKDAMQFAEDRMRDRFHEWGRNHARPKWERFSLPGGDDYQEILIQLPQWAHEYAPRHFATKNVLIHLRSTIRTLPDHQRILFVDEIQSDWHADFHNGAAASAPFRKEWPRLAFKLMIWWAQQQKLSGFAWSTAELQQQRWSGYRPPEALYKKAFPEAASTLANALHLKLSRVVLPLIEHKWWIYPASEGWRVYGRDRKLHPEVFRLATDAQAFADEASISTSVEVPLLMLGDLPEIQQIPLWGCGTRRDWCASNQ